MQTASLLLALGGDGTMTVPKYGVTPAEVLLLRAIHGEEAVTDIDIQDGEAKSIDNDEKKRTSREERARLFEQYAKVTPDGGTKLPQLDALFPGVSAKLPETFGELELDDAFYKAEGRKTPEKVDADNEGETSYKLKTVDQLKALAEEREVDLGDAKKKDDIIAKLEEADTAAGGEGGNQNLFQ
jgi:hypothetical protein